MEPLDDKAMKTALSEKPNNRGTISDANIDSITSRSVWFDKELRQPPYFNTEVSTEPTSNNLLNITVKMETIAIETDNMMDLNQ